MKKVALVGHCGPDNSFLRMIIRRANPATEVVIVGDETELKQALEGSVDLLLLNRELTYGFDDDLGIDLIKRVRPLYPNSQIMLVSNHAEAQEEAVAAGALPGFGKRELSSPRVAGLIREALS